jgi:hypothetical protein
MTSVSIVRVDDAGIPLQAGVPRVASTRLTVSYPTANRGSDVLVRPSDELATADPPPAAASSTITISTSAVLPRSVVINEGFLAVMWQRVRIAPVRLFIALLLFAVCCPWVLGVRAMASDFCKGWRLRHSTEHVPDHERRG